MEQVSGLCQTPKRPAFENFYTNFFWSINGCGALLVCLMMRDIGHVTDLSSLTRPSSGFFGIRPPRACGGRIIRNLQGIKKAGRLSPKKIGFGAKWSQSYQKKSGINAIKFLKSEPTTVNDLLKSPSIFSPVLLFAPAVIKCMSRPILPNTFATNAEIKYPLKIWKQRFRNS